jgi:hypothetical protein
MMVISKKKLGYGPQKNRIQKTENEKNSQQVKVAIKAFLPKNFQWP